MDWNGNFIDWETADWKKINVDVENENLTNMCQAEKLGPVLFPERLEATSFQTLCHQFNGKMFAVTNENERDTALSLQRQSRTTIDKCNGK